MPEQGDIAESPFLSVRTVESYLYHARVKAGQKLARSPRERVAGAGAAAAASAHRLDERLCGITSAH
ncbi:hypothetical protein [Cryobacterium sp. Y50]|uniref:hypothetical protein n=1 Tax=Cryobacterium sp. Y50 TaxID=2048286 RepID=UPI0011B0A59C|nr:hypothetical protein [Cryobacterium sp. Y50]